MTIEAFIAAAGIVVTAIVFEAGAMYFRARTQDHSPDITVRSVASDAEKSAVKTT